MRARTSVIDRTVALAAGLLLVAGAALTAAWTLDVEWARTLVRRFDRADIAAVPDQPWWPAALGVTAVVAFVLGVALLLVNLRRARPETMSVPQDESVSHGEPTGFAGLGEFGEATLSVDLGPLAAGLAGELSALDGVRTVRSTAVDDRGLATLRVVVVAEPGIDVARFTRSAELFARSMAAALPGAPVATQVLLHLAPA